MTKEYTAYSKVSNLVISIISVFAKSEDEAKERIEKELDKPGREKYLDEWKGGGELIKEK